ncbi:uncharacterized protein LACBIDRAFT_328616 [Laccaria bicolor S238N-H82]|uniref:Predicted protein n=1 Tax=Laccaria bicolor (strain S238N-H82 / ATCC MYA-4686) TaxID=486041 RepID=B0DFF7_LACBS|nr:uncharacterized protein LACBIDRAFT_328616 [Laccaria bicolor S238N-H82]EDR06855.1 predicted protein [Laccaria bicolor S238N-H82]|eukprot:XP_001882702.1 predicted protein [Laccaria bicolor S238N-H82]
MTLQGVPQPPWPVIVDLCRNFSPEQARVAPDCVTILAKGIRSMAGQSNGAGCLFSDCHERPLTAKADHPSILQACLSLSFRSMIPDHHPPHILDLHRSPASTRNENPIFNVDINISDLHYNVDLTYHYAGGIALAALKRWPEAEEYFEIPRRCRWGFEDVEAGSADIQGQDILYSHFVTGEKISQAVARAPRWVLKKLTATYSPFTSRTLAKQSRSVQRTRSGNFSMIESNDISAQVSTVGTVTCSDPPPQFTKEQVDEALLDVQHQTAVKSRDDSPWAPTVDEEMFVGISASQAMWEEMHVRLEHSLRPHIHSRPLLLRRYHYRCISGFYSFPTPHEPVEFVTCMFSTSSANIDTTFPALIIMSSASNCFREHIFIVSARSTDFARPARVFSIERTFSAYNK